jgi:hypothetical protein
MLLDTASICAIRQSSQNTRKVAAEYTEFLPTSL